MNRFEQPPIEEGNSSEIYAKEVEEIALQASEMPEFQEAVSNAKGKIEAIKDIRVLLSTRFPEISELPEPNWQPKQKYSGRIDGTIPPPSNDFKIARHVVDLLWDNK